MGHPNLCRRLHFCGLYPDDGSLLTDKKPAAMTSAAQVNQLTTVATVGDRFEAEELEFYNRVRDGYLELASEDERIQLIYADRPIETVHRHVLTLLGFD